MLHKTAEQHARLNLAKVRQTIFAHILGTNIILRKRTTDMENPHLNIAMSLSFVSLNTKNAKNGAKVLVIDIIENSTLVVTAGTPGG